MTMQRGRHGRWAEFYLERPIQDRRGNIQMKPDIDNPLRSRVAEYVQRGNKAEVPGQQEVFVTRLLVDWKVGQQVTMQTRIHYEGKWWDVAAPPMPHYGPVQTRHYSIDVRERTGGTPFG